MASMKKVMKYRWQPRNGCDDKLMTKILMTTIQVNFVLIPSEARDEVTRNYLNCHYYFVTYLPSQPFIGRHLYFTTFFMLAILHRATPFFYSLAVFIYSDYIMCYALYS